MADPKKPICGNCGRARLVAKLEVEEQGTVEPKGNCGVCPVCYHADVLDLDELKQAEKQASADSEADAD